ncbi:hypothetical protein Q5752_000948 [Cryptotrichosporon argae]
MPGLALDSRLKMHDGHLIPQFGLGVYEMTSDETYGAVKAALEAGYRHVDTAEWYENEAPVGKAINDFCAETGTPRADIFLTSKLMHNETYERTLRDLKTSLRKAGVDRFDLYLMHSAIGGPQIRKEVWRALVDAKKQGLVTSIGVSNWGAKHIDELVKAGSELPVVNQIDLHPFMRHFDIVEECGKHGILLEAWAPLVRGLRFDHPALVAVAKQHAKEPAQILLRWGLQHGFIVIPKSVSPKRIVSNSQIFDFELSDADMAQLDKLDEYLVTDWDVVDCD